MTTQPTLFATPRQKRPPRVKGVKTKAGQRSLAFLRKRGYTAEVCEQFKARVQGKGQAAKFAGGFRKDLFGFADIIAFSPDETVAVQTTTRMQMTAHLRAYRRDLETAERIRRWLSHPTRRLVVHGWECVQVPCRSKAGTKAQWQLTEREVSVGDLVEEGKN
jgi:hypothetical protein